MRPSRINRRLVAALAALVFVLGAAAVAVITGGDEGSERPTAVRPTSPSAPVLPTTSADGATTPPTTPAQPAPFPTTDCTPLKPAGDGALGLGIPRPARLEVDAVERAAFDAAAACLAAMGGAPPVLRTQLPIDAVRRKAVGRDEHAELQAYARLLLAAPPGTRGIISIRAHDFTRCGRGGAPRAVERTTLGPDEALRRCEYPSVDLYRELFTQLQATFSAALGPGIDVRWTAWNEPDHPTFTLLDGFGQEGAARRAGEYWTQAAAVVGADHVLAGEFADRDLPTLLKLRDAFVAGTGGVAPPSWAIHPYRDLTAPAAQHVVDGFEQAVAPAPVWLTEVGARLSGREGITGKPGAQRARGETLRARVERTPTRVVLYLLTPPPAPQNKAQDGWDSAIADRAARARPFLCGLAALPAARCPGSPAKFGG
ncbi:MAG: hypothetical protein Q7T55_00575 [Solirubrobacteraceae bacterium]|nr:hypothetical protein [Solirubrobacteraceae bacterium]